MELSVLGRAEERWIQLSAFWWDDRCRNWRSSSSLSCPGSWPQGRGGAAKRCDGAPDLVAAIKRCSKKQDLEGGRELHRVAAAAGLEYNRYVAASLITMYSKCCSMELAKQVFDGLVHRNVVAWTSLILGYAENGESSVAMDLFSRMDCKPDSVIFLAVLKACGDLARKAESQAQKEACLAKGIDIHRQIEECGFGSNICVAGKLLHMYSQCGSMQRARDVFDRMISKTVVCWNALILGYVDNGHSLLALDLFTSMECEADSFTYVAAFKACGELAGEEESEKQQRWLQKGIAIHKQARDQGLESVIFVANSLVDMYSKCGAMDLAREVFDRMVHKDVVTWNSLILGYVQNKDNSTALDLFSRMDCDPDTVTYLSALKACGGLASAKDLDKQSCLERGILIHKRLTESGIRSDVVLATALMDMYSKCGSMKLAREVFDGLIHPTAVAWTVLIQGYVENGDSSVALELFTGMDAEPSAVTYVAVLRACANLAALAAGQQIHAAICKLGLEQDRLLTNTLIDFYCKCGSLNRAEELFNSMHSPDIASWSALMAGFSFFGDSSRAFSLAKQMQEAGLQMDGVSLTCVLTACNHAGLVDEWQLFFQSAMKSGVSLTVEHYSSMIDILGRANKLEEAMALVNSMPFKGDQVIWLTLLGACKKWKNLEVGRVAFNELVATSSLETRAASAPFVLMSNVCAS